MAERTSVTQVVQIGKETTSGTSVAADKLLQSMMIDASIATSVQKFRPSGSKVNTVTAQGKEWVEAKISGQPCYTELQYPLSSILKLVTPSTVATTGKKWTITPSSSAEDTVATFTVEQGSAVRAHKFTYGIVNEFGLKWDRDSVSMSGSMFGQALSDGISLTGTPTALPLIPILPKEASVYLDTTGAGLGTTKLTRVLSGELNIASRFGPLWVVDAAQTSFAAHVEQPIEIEMKLMLEADSNGMALLSRLRDGATRFIRVEFVSPQLVGTATPYSLRLEMAGQITDVSDFSDQQGVYAVEWTFTGVQDATWGKFLNVELTNQQAAL